VKQLQHVVAKRSKVKNIDDVHCIENAYNPAKTKAIIGKFDMFVTGRVHASVAAVSQCIPTVFIEYEKSENSGKTYGLASIVGLEEYVSKPIADDIISKIDMCFANRSKIHSHFQKRIPEVKNMS
jgi:colanic acid/amylovoran biosynthesis protein